ncbi:MAG: hypothetical protein AAGA58_14075 [Verrucomicrobiota bacterium]
MKTAFVIFSLMFLPLVSQGTNYQFTGGKYWIFHLKSTQTAFNPKGVFNCKFVPKPPLVFCGYAGTAKATVVKFPEGPRDRLNSARFRVRDDIHVILFSNRETLVKNYTVGKTGKKNQVTKEEEMTYPEAVTIGDDETYEVAIFTRKGFFVWEGEEFVEKNPKDLELPNFDDYLEEK